MYITPEDAEEITKNIELASEFLRYLIKNPSEMEKIPDGSQITIYRKFKKASTEVNAKGF